jgi:hypothetical protein
MQRRYFEHLYKEVCVAIDRRISRYDLWLLLWEGGGDPDTLTHAQARYFLEHNLSLILTEEGTSLSPRARHRLEKRILHFDPDRPTPEEWLANILDPRENAA